MFMFSFPPTKQITVLGESLEYVASGSGPSTVVLVNGSGGPIEGWHKVFPALTAVSTVFAYNRPGIGRSSKPRAPQTASHMVASLRNALKAAGLHPPYVLAGHSLGGLVVNLYARLHPQEVAAVVFLEATTPEDVQTFAQGQSRMQGFISTWLERIMPTPENAETKHVAASVAEILDAPRFPPVPLIVITGGKLAMTWAVGPDALAARAASQRALVNLSPQGQQIIAAASGHFPQFSEPELVANAINEIAIRTERRSPNEWTGLEADQT
jgi:pimeloyl-ACP methyl ester carboxylesterase